MGAIVPLIDIPGGFQRTTVRTASVVIAPVVTLAWCGSTTEDLRTIYRWVPSVALPTSVALTQKDIFIPANTLQAPSILSLQLQVSLAFNPSQVTLVEVTVHCVQQALVARIDPGGTVDVGVTSRLLLSGARSSDPDGVVGEGARCVAVLEAPVAVA